jgi:hypothetical protein
MFTTILTTFSTISGWLKEPVSFVTHLLTWHAFGVLALLPGFLALFNLIRLGSIFDKAKEAADKIPEKKKHLVPVFVKAGTELDDYRPRAIYTILGAFCLTTVFEIVAAIGGGAGRLAPYDFGVARVQSEKSSATNISELPSASGVEQRVKSGAAAGAAKGGQQKQDKPEPRSTVSGLAGLVYAGYGAYIYTLILVISRLNSSALTGQFLAVSSVRSGIALVLGFAAADTNIFSGLTANQGLFVLFFIGLFPSWAMDAVRRKAQEIFKPREQGCEVLPICLIDGLDDGIGDRLAELGVWDIQHITAADPFVLAAKSLYPIRRVIDWMDQAILISYVRGQIVHFRAIGVRGAIDFAVLYQDAMGFDAGEVEGLSTAESQAAYRKTLEDRATRILKVLAQKSGFSEDSLYVIGRSFYEDAVVNFIWDIWFADDQQGSGVSPPARRASPAAPETVPPPLSPPNSTPPVKPEPPAQPAPSEPKTPG